MTDTIRAALERMILDLDAWCDTWHPLAYTDPRISLRLIADRARAALAEGDGVGVTDEELRQLADDYWNLRPDQECAPVFLVTVWDFARAVLARYGTAHPRPIPVAERLPTAADYDESGLTCNGGGWCWWFDQPSQMWVADFYSRHYTHWLPAAAIPLPEATT